MEKKIIVIDDEANIRRALQIVLKGEGYCVHVAQSALQAYSQLQSQNYDLAIIDIKLDGISGIELFQKLRADGISVPVIFISGNASLSEAAQAVRLGAFDFLEKPFNQEKLCISVQRCLEHELMKSKIEELDAQIGKDSYIGASENSKTLLRDVSKVARSPATVLIQGESGTGKELVAKLIHDQSDRKREAFIKVNCSAIPENLIESELFGYERGAFTGALQSKRGTFERAHRGTLFLDEIGDMSLSAQAKILRAIQNAEIQRVGSEKSTIIDVRLIAATNKDLASEVKAGRFREDLFYRIKVVPLETTPLRNRREDIPLLITWFVNRYCDLNGLKKKQVDIEVLSTFQKYHWPGNVRELQNLVERLVIMGGDPIRVTDLPIEYRQENSPPLALSDRGLSWQEFKEANERSYLVNILRQKTGNISAAAELLKIERTYLHKKISQFKIEKREFFN